VRNSRSKQDDVIVVETSMPDSGRDFGIYSSHSTCRYTAQGVHGEPTCPEGVVFSEDHRMYRAAPHRAHALAFGFSSVSHALHEFGNYMVSKAQLTVVVLAAAVQGAV